MALFEPKGKRNRENKLNLKEGTILCLLDNLEQNAQRFPAKIADELCVLEKAGNRTIDAPDLTLYCE